jgi:hypothetical protein
MIRFVRRILRAIRVRLGENLDLFGLVLGCAIVQPLVPPGGFLDRDDLAPWFALVVAAAAALRETRLGPGPHPMLAPRSAALGSLLRHAGRVAAPLLLLAWFEVGRVACVAGAITDVLTAIGIAAVGTVLTVGAFVLGADDGRTAWNPAGSPGPVGWGIGAGLVVALSSAFGFLVGSGQPVPSWLAMAGWLGLLVLGTGLALGRPRELGQRRAASPLQSFVPITFRHGLALIGPTFTLASLQSLLLILRGEVIAFDEAWIAAVVVALWAAVLWPQPVPIGLTCLLHEVVPVGGNDRGSNDGAAVPFDRAPEGSLRFNPLRTVRIQAVHPWLVPIRAARIAELDDPVRALWAPSTPRLAFHILGEAVFEPDPLTASPQWTEITIHLRGREDVSTLSSTDVQTRRLVVLRPFPSPGTSRRAAMTTWRWDRSIPAESYQLLDATTATARIRHGDVLVMSLEGVARAFEVEFGAPVYTLRDAMDFRPPQVRDYVGVG